MQLSTRFEVRDDPAVTANYGSLLVDLAGAIPDGIVCFFTSYMYMERAVEAWHRDGILAKVLERKLVFIETKVRNQWVHGWPWGEAQESLKKAKGQKQKERRGKGSRWEG